MLQFHFLRRDTEKCKNFNYFIVSVLFFRLSVFRLGPPTLLLHSPSHLPFNKRVGYLKSIPVSARSRIQFSAEEVCDFRTSWQRASTKAVYSSLFFRSDLESSENAVETSSYVSGCMETTSICRNVSGSDKFKNAITDKTFIWHV